MRKIISTVLILSIFAQPIIQGWLISSFIINRDFIIQVFCEKPTQPITVCGGVCYLKKQLSKTKNEHEGPLSEKTEKIEIIYFFKENLPISFSVTKTKLKDSFDSELRTLLLTLSLFRPPQQSLKIS